MAHVCVAVALDRIQWCIRWEEYAGFKSFFITPQAWRKSQVSGFIVLVADNITCTPVWELSAKKFIFMTGVVAIEFDGNTCGCMATREREDELVMKPLVSNVDETKSILRRVKTYWPPA